MATECFVPLCGSSLVDCPEKFFFAVPNETIDLKLLWFTSVGVDLSEWTKQRETEGKSLTAYCCQDHFDLLEDVVNLNGLRECSGGVVDAGLLKPEVVPHIFGPSAEDPLIADGGELDGGEMEDPLALGVEYDSKNLEGSSITLNARNEGFENVKELSCDVVLLENEGVRNHLEASTKTPFIRIKKPVELISKTLNNATLEVKGKMELDASRPTRAKQCIVPNCPSSTDNRPEDDFVCVPMTVIRKKAWMAAINRKWTNDVAKGIQHCCVDHFKESDLEHYNQNVSQGGFVTKRRARDGVLPCISLPGNTEPGNIKGSSIARLTPKSVLEARKRKLEHCQEVQQGGYSHLDIVVDKSKYRSLKLCQVCFELFESEASYEAHIKFPCSENRPEISPTRCRACKFNCSSLADLTAHVESVHKYICVGCDESFSEMQVLKLHILSGCENGKTGVDNNGKASGKRRKSAEKSGEDPTNPSSDSSCDVVFVDEEKLGVTKTERLSVDEEILYSALTGKRKNLRAKCRPSVKLNDSNFKTSPSMGSSANEEDDTTEEEENYGENKDGIDDSGSDRDWRRPPKKKGVVKRGRGRPRGSCNRSNLQKAKRNVDNDPDYRPTEKESESDPDDPSSFKDSDDSFDNKGAAMKSGIATCWKCKKRFKNLPALKTHMKNSPGCKMDASQKLAALRVQCKSCLVYFTSSLGLGLHLKRSKTCMKNNPDAVLPGVIPSYQADKGDKREDSEPKVFVCSKCKATFTSVWGLRTHERNSTTCKPDKPYAIPVPVDKSEAERMKKERNLLVEKQNAKKEPTILYTPRIQENDATPFKCKNCQAIFTSVWGLRTHERISLKCGTRIQKDGASKNKDKSPIIVFPEVSSWKTTADCVCKTCKAKFTSYRGYSAHLRLSSSCGGSCKKVKTQTPIQSSPLPAKSENNLDGGSYLCPMCHNSFVGSLEFTIHFSEHGNLMKSRGKYNCFVCQKKFVDVSSLYRHTYCDHVGEWFCPICSFNFNSFKLFFEHVNGQHNNGFGAKKLPQCDYCMRSFTTSDCLKWHSMNCPPLPKPTFSCSICAKKFLKKLHITNHIRYCHLNLPADDRYCYQCSKCPRLFASAEDLAVHAKDDCVKAEEIVKCDLCSSSFLGRVFLKKHIGLCHPEVNPADEMDNANVNNVDSIITIKEEFTFVEVKEEPGSGMEPETVGPEFEGEHGQ